MKKIILTALFAAFALPAFSQAGSVFDIQTQKFVRDKNMVDVEFTIGVDGKNLHSTEQWTITPVIRSGNTEQRLAPITIVGRNRGNILVREQNLRGMELPAVLYKVRRRDNTTITYTKMVPYQDWMKGATLVLDETCISCQQAHNFTDNMGNIFAPEPPRPYVVAMQPAYVIPVQEEVKERNIEATAFIDFAVNSTAIQRNFRQNPQELDKIMNTLNEVKNDKDLTFKGIHLQGFASPEGGYANNERLANGRVQALRNYVASNFSVPASNIATGYTAEDWTGLKALIEKSQINGKSELLAIVNSTDAPDTKEANMKRVLGGAPWRVILTDMMPGLRRTDYRVDFTVREYNLQDSREIYRSNPSLLSHYELDLLAKEFGANSPEYARIYGLIDKQFPTDDNANLNVAAYKISKGDYAGAKINLDRVSVKIPAYYNNLGIVQMMQGNHAEAERSFRQAGNNADAQHNLREVAKFLEVQREIESFK